MWKFQIRRADVFEKQMSLMFRALSRINIFDHLIDAQRSLQL